MKKKTWLFFGIPLIAASILIGTGYAAWNFSGGSDNNRRNLDIGVTDVDNKTIERAYYWFGEKSFTGTDGAFPSASKNDPQSNKSTVAPASFSVTQYTLTITSPFNVRAYLTDAVTQGPYNLEFSFSIKAEFDKWFELTVQATDGASFPIVSDVTKVTSTKGENAALTDALGKYVQFDPFYIIGSYRQGMIPHTKEQMDEVLSIINKEYTEADPIVKINITSSFGKTTTK